MKRLLSAAVLLVGVTAPVWGDEAKKTTEDAEASKLLAAAIAQRATWADFPGFHAKVTINDDGKVTHGVVEVARSGKVSLKMKGDEQAWAKSTLASIVGHRMAGPTAENRCAFADDMTDHPLGRALKVLNDEFHSSYRVRDNQVIEVNRSMGNLRFTITVLKNNLNAEKKYLPASYVVSYWDAKSGVLKKSQAHHNAWKRVGKYDLPARAVVVTAEDGKQTARSIKLTGHKLGE
jgi:hypothetical protein